MPCWPCTGELLLLSCSVLHELTLEQSRPDRPISDSCEGVGTAAAVAREGAGGDNGAGAIDHARSDLFDNIALDRKV